MKNPLTALSSLFTGTGQPPAPPKDTPPPAAKAEPEIKVEVPAEVVEAAAATAAIKPRLPRESFKQHNREIEQKVKAANMHRPMTPRSMPHARGR
jgi:hypothetical protein